VIEPEYGDVRPASLKHWLVIIGVILFMFASAIVLFSCGPQSAGDVAMDAGQQVDLTQPEALPSGYPPPPGNLPPGYNERGCQWDGCTGPPDRLGPVVNPNPNIGDRP